uniref:Uncharacterized protein n=1 Tax=Timema cristinae TaxID=61476 RepID=A0A7R9CK09_TIMCR|nr:unnamed protein product [Timema cristinae]
MINRILPVNQARGGVVSAHGQEPTGLEIDSRSSNHFPDEQRSELLFIRASLCQHCPYATSGLIKREGGEVWFRGMKSGAGFVGEYLYTRPGVNSDLPVIGSLVYCESDTLDHMATEVAVN